MVDNSNKDIIYMGKELTDASSESNTAVLTKPKTKKPPMYKVLLLNDDYTPMDFVVMILEKIFNKTNPEAIEIMMTVHRKGVGLCGIYTYEIAETKIEQVMEFARQNEYPLQCIMEKE